MVFYSRSNYEGSRIQGLLCQAGDELLAVTIENESLKKLKQVSDMLLDTTRSVAEPKNNTKTEVKMNAKIVRAGWFNLLVYRLFYLCWNKILAARPDLWDKIRGTPSQPLYVSGEMRKILEYRTGRCAGCEWHPDVCDHCIRSFDEDFDVPPTIILGSSGEKSATNGGSVPEGLSSFVKSFVRCEVLLPHSRNINGKLYMIESGIVSLPDDKDTSNSIAHGYLRLVP